MTKAGLLGTTALMVLLTMAGAAAAQTAPPQTPEAQQTDEIGEIIVTARRRSEQLQDVPASVTAITEADRETLVLDGIDDYLRQVQGANLVSSGPEYLNDISIRGQGSGRIGFTETATALYRNGLYNSGGGYGGRTLSRLDLFDMARMEVLRGPQGALFGRNAVGGAINVISNTPSRDFEASAAIRYSDPGRTDVEAVVSGPFSERIAGRLGAYMSEQNAGFHYNTTVGDYADTQSAHGARGSIEARLSDSATLNFMAEYGWSDAPAFTGMAQSPVFDPDPYVRNHQDRMGRAVIEESAFGVGAEFDLGWADLSLQMMHRRRDGQRTNEDSDNGAGFSLTDVEPGAGVSYPDYSRAQFEDYSRAVYQATLVSNGDTGLSWLLGIEWLTSDDSVLFAPDMCPTYTGVAQPVTPGCFVGLSQPGSPATFSNPARNQGRITMNSDTFNEEVSSVSLFGSLEARFAENWLATVELRFQNDDRDFDFQRWSLDPLVYFGNGAVPAGMLAPLGGYGVSTLQFCPPTLSAAECRAGNEAVSLESDSNRTFFTPALSLRWNFAEGQNLYGRFATAYRSGGFNTNLPPTMTRASMPSSLVYEPEYAYNYEAGWKGRLWGFYAEAAIYYTWTNEVQVVTAPVAGGSGYVLSNAGDAHAYGFEAEARRTFRVGPGRLSTRFAFSTSGGAFEEGASLVNQGVFVDLNGLELPRLRDYQITANLNYSQEIGSYRVFAGVSAQLADGGFDNPGNTREYSAYDLYDARIGISRGNWRFSVFGRNLTDERYVLAWITDDAYWSQPRVVGAELRMNY